jgi:hypothetical protein
MLFDSSCAADDTRWARVSVVTFERYALKI